MTAPPIISEAQKRLSGTFFYVLIKKAGMIVFCDLLIYGKSVAVIA